MNDTGAKASRRYHELLRSRAPHERLAQALALTKMVRDLAIAGIKSRHPDADDAEIRVRLAVRLYGRDAAEQMFGEVPPDAV